MKTISFNFSTAFVALGAIVALASPPSLLAQGNYLSIDPPQKAAARRNGTVELKLSLHVQNGYHVNSNSPLEDYLIPLRLRWEPGPLTPVETLFPKPELQKYDFSEKPLSVFTGDFPIIVRFKVAPDAAAGPGVLLGKLRYQACSHDTCYRPATIEIRLPYQIQ